MHSYLKALQEKHQELKAKEPHLRARKAAELLGANEMELLLSQSTNRIKTLSGPWTSLLSELVPLGKVMALTRNNYVVHERKGVYDNVKFFTGGQMGVAVNPDIDLRFFMSNWKYGFAVYYEGKRQMRSFQFFDQYGQAVHKIFSFDPDRWDFFESLVEKYSQEEVTLDLPLPKAPLPDTPVMNLNESEISAFQESWRNLKDTHDFFPLLKKYKLHRVHALEIAPEGMTQALPTDILSGLLTKAAEQKVPIMAFVGNHGCLQIHSGEINRVAWVKKWFNVLDPDFNLHIDTMGIDQIWHVQKPTVDGIINSIEVFDKDGNMMVQFFGKRKPGIPELDTWKNLLETVQQANEPTN
ncbi:MAG: ChuX/HutX family heme-like substrate-binding protein [Bacteroidota bacterium]